MDKITKALAKLSKLECQKVKEVFEAILSGATSGLDIKKIRDQNNIFRVRCGQIRVIYKKGLNGKVFFISVGRRNEKTYPRTRKP